MHSANRSYMPDDLTSVTGQFEVEHIFIEMCIRYCLWLPRWIGLSSLMMIRSQGTE